MSKPSLPSESPNASMEEINKVDLARTLYNEIISDKAACDAILDRVKWSLDSRKQDSNLPWAAQRIENRLSGNLIGFLAEALDEKIGLTQVETVFNPRNIPLAELTIVSPQMYSGASTNKKGDVFSQLLRDSFQKPPLQTFGLKRRAKDNPMLERFREQREHDKAPQVPPVEFVRLFQEYLEKMKPVTEEEIVQGYAWNEVRDKKNKKTIYPAGEWYGATVIPDGLVLWKGKLVGMYETKAIKAEELDKAMSLIRRDQKRGDRETVAVGKASDFGYKYPGADKEPFKIGVDLDKEAEFVDILRGLREQGENLGVNNLIVLRFPNDIPNNLLAQYGEMLVSSGYRNIAIQKLPFSREDINVIARAIVKSRWQFLYNQLRGDKNFSLRDLDVIGRYAEIEK